VGGVHGNLFEAEKAMYASGTERLPNPARAEHYGRFLAMVRHGDELLGMG
jgi:hypothetical protein